MLIQEPISNPYAVIDDLFGKYKASIEGNTQALQDSSDWGIPTYFDGVLSDENALNLVRK